jgi:hypothetical protein
MEGSMRSMEKTCMPAGNRSWLGVARSALVAASLAVLTVGCAGQTTASDETDAESDSTESALYCNSYCSCVTRTLTQYNNEVGGCTSDNYGTSYGIEKCVKNAWSHLQSGVSTCEAADDAVNEILWGE